MIALFYRGEPLYMSVLTLLLLVIFFMSSKQAMLLFQGKLTAVEKNKKCISVIKSVGLFTLMFGLFTQLLGFYGAFIAVEQWGSVSPEILATGLWTSSIPSFYGLIIWLLSYLLGYGLALLNQVKFSA